MSALALSERGRGRAGAWLAQTPPRPIGWNGGARLWLGPQPAPDLAQRLVSDRRLSTRRRVVVESLDGGRKGKDVTHSGQMVRVAVGRHAATLRYRRRPRSKALALGA